MSALVLADLVRCFQGVIPCVVATADASGVPNVTYVSHLYLVDAKHVALSRQFFNKTAKNLVENPRASVTFYDPVTFEAYELLLRYLRTETSGPLFAKMSMRIDAIASHTGMKGVFTLVGADVLEVVAAEKVEGFIAPPACEDGGIGLDGLRTELRGLQWVAERINRAGDLDELLEAVLEALASFFGFTHTRVFVHEETTGRLVTLASRGYGEASIGAEVAIGDGVVGTVAKERSLLRISGLREGLSYGRAVRREVMSIGGRDVEAEIPLFGLPDAESALAIPLVVRSRLLGVIAAESRDRLAFDEWDESYLDVVGNQIALGIERMLDDANDDADAPTSSTPSAVPASPDAKKRTFCLYKNDDAIFVDGEYLIRNVPARILWSVLTAWVREGRTAFTNRELRLDPTLGLPALKDNLESRLILLRKRLEAKCPDVRLTSTGRGRFELCADGPIELVEKGTA